MADVARAKVTRAMRAFPVLAAIVVTAPAANASDSFELEVGGGVAHTLEDPENGAGPTTSFPFAVPALTARAAYDFAEHFSVGVSFVAVIGREAPDSGAVSPFRGDPSGFKAVATLVSARVHTTGSTQLWLSGGLGIGHLISLQQNDAFEHPPLRGHAGPAFDVAVGLRQFVWDRAWAGIELDTLLWTNVEHSQASNFPAATGLSTWALLLLVSVGFAP